MKRLAEPDVCKLRLCSEPRPQFLGELDDVAVAGTGHRDVEDRARAVAHDLADEITRLEGKGRAWELGGQHLPESGDQRGKAYASPGPQGDVDDRLMRPAGPQEHEIDRVGRTLRADIAEGHVDISRTGLVAHDRQDPLDLRLGCGDARALRSVHPQANLIGGAGGEDFRAEEKTGHDEHGRDPAGVAEKQQTASAIQALLHACKAAP